MEYGYHRRCVIFKEISDDLGTIFLPGSGNLFWAKVFTFERFVNREATPNSHKHLKGIFTDAVIQNFRW
jgi:uracil-DNA glycosylase